MSDSVEPGTTGVAVPPQTRAQARERATQRRSRCRTPAAGDSGTASPSPASGARSCSRACRSRRRCSPAPGSSRGSSGASPRPSGTASGWCSPSSCGPSPTATSGRPSRSTWRISLIAGGVLLAVFFALGQYWQHQIRDLMGVTEYNVALVVLSPVVALGVFALLLVIGRGLRALYRGLGAAAATLDRPPRGQRRRLDRRGRADLPGDQRRAPRRAGERGQRDVLAARHDHPGGRAAADHRPAVRRDGLAHRLGHPRLAGPDVHRHRARPRTRSRPSMHRPAKEPIRAYAGLATADGRRDARPPRRRRPRARGRLPARRTCSSPAPPAAAGSTPRPPTPSSTSPAATRPSSACSTPTCRPGCPTWSTRPRRGRRAAPSSTPSTSGGRRCRPGAGPASS